MREQRQLVTLNQIWRFLSFQMDKDKLIEAKIKKMEEEENLSDDEDEDEPDSDSADSVKRL